MLVGSASGVPVGRATLVGVTFGWCWTRASRTESTSLVNRSGSVRAPSQDLVRLRHTPFDEGPVRTWPLERPAAWSGAKEGQDGQHPAMLVGRLGQAELLEDLGGVGLHGAFGDIQPGGDGPVG